MNCAPITHKLKIQDRFYEAIKTGVKTFEVRKDDRGFEVCNRIEFTDLDGKPREGEWEITYKLTHEDFPEGIPEGYCILGIYPIHRISDKRLCEIFNGSKIADAEKAKIIGLAVEHCRKSEPDPYTLVIHKAGQGGTWWDAFKALFWYMEGWQ